MQRLFLTSVLSLLFCIDITLADSSRIVKIRSEKSYGTGFLIDSKRNIYATNLHVCSKSYSPSGYSLSRIKLESDTGDSYPARILEIDNKHDICIVSIETTITRKHLILADSELPPTTEMDILTLPDYGKRIHILNIGRDYTSDPWMFTHIHSNVADGLCKPGMSGSPIVYNDRVVGQVWGCSDKESKVLYTSIKYVQNLLRRVIGR